MKRTTVAAFLLSVSAISSANAQDASPGSILSGIFTEQQAQRGKIAYQQFCAICHGADLFPTNPEAAPLTGEVFNFSWHGNTIAERFERISTTMPEGKAGTLNDNEIIDVIAYILQFNGYPIGEQELEPDGLIVRDSRVRSTIRWLATILAIAGETIGLFLPERDATIFKPR